MIEDSQFQGWAGLDEKAGHGNLVFQPFTPKVWDEDDVEVKILYCAVCGSDSAVLAGEWGPVKDLVPQVLGHEIVGEVVTVGKEVMNGLEEGDLVGIGAQCDSCMGCETCRAGDEHLCHQMVSCSFCLSPLFFAWAS